MGVASIVALIRPVPDPISADPCPIPPRPRRRERPAQALGALSTVGFAFVLAVVIGSWPVTGSTAWLGTSPLFIVFFFFGLAAGVLNVVRTAANVTRDDDE